MHKVTKRALALLLACTLVFSSGMRSRSYAMAGGGVIAGGGAVIGAETALAYLLGILGFSAASAVVYDNRDSIAKWGKTQVGRLTKYIDEKKDQLNCTVESMQDWLTKLGKGTLDTAAAEWSAVKAWAGTLYGSGGMVDTVITDQSSYPVVDGTSNISDRKSWTFSKHGSDYGWDHDQLYEYSILDNSNAILFTVMAVDSDALFVCAVSDKSGGQLRILTQNVHDHNTTTIDDQTWDIQYSIGNGLYYAILSELSIDITKIVLPNFIGTVPHGNSEWGLVNDATFRTNACNKAWNMYKNGSFAVPKTKDYETIGGISSVYDAGKTLDNITVVGVGDKAGVTDVTIPWPKDDSFGGLIGGTITGTNTWTDVIGAANVGVIEREGTKDWVIDNAGVTTKEWDYATDIPGTGDIDKPGTDTGDTDADVSKDLSDYTFAGLEKIFPFCLPFDLVDFIGVLDADPEAPKFTIPIKVPTSSGWGVYNIDIDLSKFDSVAALLRQMETLAFVVGLIMITRQKMIRG